MRRGLTFLLALAAFTTAGCYDPDVKNGGYSCTADQPHCPTGFTCINDRCVEEGSVPPPGPDSGAPPGEVDMSMSMPTGGDMAGSMSTDMAGGGQSMPDMSKPVVRDMAQAPQCLPGGASCDSDDDCCSGACLWLFVYFCG